MRRTKDRAQSATIKSRDENVLTKQADFLKYKNCECTSIFPLSNKRNCD